MDLCPIAAILSYLKARGAGLLFRFSEGCYLTRCHLVSLLLGSQGELLHIRVHQDERAWRVHIPRLVLQSSG